MTDDVPVHDLVGARKSPLARRRSRHLVRRDTPDYLRTLMCRPVQFHRVYALPFCDGWQVNHCRELLCMPQHRRMRIAPRPTVQLAWQVIAQVRP
jgi:hypothetical protein